MASLSTQAKDLPNVIQAAAITAMLGFVISLSSTSSSSTNGVVTTCNHFDLAALVLGAAAIGCGVVGLTKLRSIEASTLPAVLSAGAIVIGVVHILRGFGMILAPC